MVQLYEDRILRGKDMNARTDLARKVARMWEEQLSDAREAADAWRRVLRMRSGDAEAAAGLERAKQNMLKRPDPDASDAVRTAEDRPVITGTPVASKIAERRRPRGKHSSTLETASPSTEAPDTTAASEEPQTESSLDEAPTASSVTSRRRLHRRRRHAPIGPAMSGSARHRTRRR